MDAKLKRKFREYNRKYFAGRLPSETVVDWHYNLPGDAEGACHVHGLTACSQIPASYGRCSGTHLILLNTRLWPDVDGSYFTLLHEMNHLDVVLSNGTARSPHGESFQNGMKRLAMIDAFRRFW